MTCSTDFSAAEFVADPYPELAELRAQGPLLWHKPTERWLATTHASVSQTLRNRALGRIWSDWEPGATMEPYNALHRNQMMENEPPVHTRMRRLVAGAFARGHVERMRPRVEAIAASLLGEMAGTVDILADYAEPLPVLVIADLLGVPGDDHGQLREWSQSIVHMYEQEPSAEVRQQAVRASIEFDHYVRDLLAGRKQELLRGARRQDLIGDLLTETSAGQGLSDDELVASIVLLLNAGHEASVNAFGNGIHALLDHRDQRARLTSGEVTTERALEELIRFDAPLQLFERTATDNTTIMGQQITAGQRVACLMGSANRDEAVFEHPEELNVGRDPNPHVGFGMGVHFCLGAPLARMELEISLRLLLAEFPRLQLSGTAPRRPTWVLRGFERIEMDVDGR